MQDETEYETDSDEEGYGQQILKPQFIRKAERDVSKIGLCRHVMSMASALAACEASAALCLTGCCTLSYDRLVGNMMQCLAVDKYLWSCRR